MFSSPSIRLYTSENVDNLVQRKPGNSLLSRKPFVDRSVNSKTPDQGKLRKQKLNLLEQLATTEKPECPNTEDLNAEEYMYSYRDIEDPYENIGGYRRLSTRDMVRILRNYCNGGDTPPPSIPSSPVKFESIEPIFFELPDMEFPNFQVNEDFLNETDDVGLPNFDYDLDTSI